MRLHLRHHSPAPELPARAATWTQLCGWLAITILAFSLLVHRSARNSDTDQDMSSSTDMVPSWRDCVYGVRESPSRCSAAAPPYTLGAILRATKSQWIHFVGDSLTRQAYYGFIALMRGQDDSSQIPTEKISGLAMQKIATTTVSFRYAPRFGNLSDALENPPTNLAQRSPTLVVAGSGLHNLLYLHESLHKDFEVLVPHIKAASQKIPVLWHLISPINDSQLAGHRLESLHFRDKNVQKLNVFQAEQLNDVSTVRIIDSHAARVPFDDSADGLHSRSQALAAAKGIFHSLAYLSADTTFSYTIVGQAITAAQVSCAIIFGVIVACLAFLEINLMFHAKSLEEASISDVNNAAQEMINLIQPPDEPPVLAQRDATLVGDDIPKRLFLAAPASPSPPAKHASEPDSFRSQRLVIAPNCGTVVCPFQRCALWYACPPLIQSNEEQRYTKVRSYSDPENLENRQEHPPKSSLRSPTEANSPQQTLRAAYVFALILCIIYLFDGPRHLMGDSLKSYNRDLFVFICICIAICSFLTVTSVRDHSVEQPLNREQTEEWKGSMQIVFVLYHYFDAKEIYNLIRVFIATYIWMTGFGNFSYHYSTADFSVSRALKMIFRLNFLAIGVCSVLNKQYMLYYICPLHTLFFLAIYVTLGAFHRYNSNEWVIKLKFLILAAILFIMFELSPNIFATFSRPLSFLLNLRGTLHEWVFRVTLDHWVAFLGAVCAYNLSLFRALLDKIDVSSVHMRVVQGCIGVSTLAALCLWARFLYTKEKLAYNAQHPYTAIVPILCYVVLRNLFSIGRNYYSRLLQWMGRISLEMYILQFHVFMCDDAKVIVTYIDGYPLLNFVVASGIYVALSYALFRSTAILSDSWIPRTSSTMCVAKISTRALPVLVLFGLVYGGVRSVGASML